MSGKTIIRFFFISLLSGFSILLPAANPAPEIDTAWADSILRSLTVEEKIGQLFMVPAYSNRGKKGIAEVDRLIKEYHIGGIIFMQGGPVRQVHFINHFQSVSNIPLLVAQDAEWGPAMRLDSTLVFPRQLTLGAVKNPDLIYDFAEEVARQCKLLGVHLNLAPVVDVNNNPLNPVINDRSFGENRYNVTLRGLMYMKGLQDHGIIACAKHFPGHGDTDKDSHKTLPVIHADRARLDSVELFPYRILISQGLMSIMSAHLLVPALEQEENLPSSLSPVVINGLLRSRMGFDGLVITDALTMKGAGEAERPGDVELQALLAGNDILLFPKDIPAAIYRIKDAINQGILSAEQLDEHVRRILLAKAFAGLDHYQPVSDSALVYALDNPYVRVLKRKLIASALTLAQDKENLIPFRQISRKRFAVLTIGGGDNSTFAARLSAYAPFDVFRISKEASRAEWDRLQKALSKYDHVVTGLFGMSRWYSRNYGVTAQAQQFLQRLNDQHRLVLCLFGSPYSLGLFPGLETVLVAYGDDTDYQDLAAQALFGGIPLEGAIPVSAGFEYPFGTGLERKEVLRLSFSLPEAVGISSMALAGITRIAREAIDLKATPGCQVLVAVKGKVIYNHAFGYFTYDKRLKVDRNDLYDVASITKVAATTLSLMYLYDRGLFSPYKTLDYYLDDLKNTTLGRLLIRDVMTHTAGLKPWIPFYAATVADSIFSEYYCETQEPPYTIQVADHLYIRNDYPDTIFKLIREAELKPKGRYKYSDLGFYLLRKIVEKLTNRPLEEFVQEKFYLPLGMYHTTFRPLEKFPRNQIVPTELDTIFRRQLVHGYVHDPGAAMLGGVSGHAGLFSTAEDLAILMQMLLNKGLYGGKRYLKDKTVQLFTARQNNRSRRGLGFDKPEPDPEAIGPTSKLVSLKTFGHTGFTGCCVWADPEYEVVYVFLSNRIHPTADNKKLISENIRTRIQDIIYQSLSKGTYEEQLALGMTDSLNIH